MLHDRDTTVLCWIAGWWFVYDGREEQICSLLTFPDHPWDCNSHI